MTPDEPASPEGRRERRARRLRQLRIAQPRSLQSRQLWAASVGLVAVLALAGFAARLKDLAAQAAEAAASGGPAAYGQLTTSVLDVTDEAGIVATVADVAARFGGIDVLANIAGAHRTTPMAARTHYVQALPTTFGFSTISWYLYDG